MRTRHKATLLSLTALALFGGGAWVGYEYAQGDETAATAPAVVTTAPGQNAMPPVAAPSPNPGRSTDGANLDADLPLLPPSVTDTPLTTLDGRTIRLRDFAGRPVVLELWGSWCPSCREQIPHMTALQREFYGKPVEFIALTMEDPKTERANVERAVQDLGMTQTIAFAPRNLVQSFARVEDGGIPIPQTIILTPEGRIARHSVSFDPSTDIASLRETLTRYASAPGAAYSAPGNATSLVPL